VIDELVAAITLCRPENLDSCKLWLQTFVQNPDLDNIISSFSVYVVPVLGS